MSDDRSSVDSLLNDQRRAVDAAEEARAQAEAARVEAEARLDKERAVLAGMEMAIDATRREAAAGGTRHPVVGHVPVQRQEPRSSGSGRQKGAISRDWRGVLGALGTGPFTDADMHHYAQETIGRSIRPADVTRRRESYQDSGLVEPSGDGFRYRVTDHAIQKFGLNRPNENGPPEGGPDDGGVGAPSADNQRRIDVG